VLQQLGNKGYDIFSYPNHVQGGLGNKHAIAFTSIFCEFDNLSLDEQWQKIKELEQIGLIPSQVVFSGSKSLHCYFRLEQSITAEEWKLFNRMLATYMGSDPSICTLARAMRLPGVNRVKNGEVKAVEILSQSDATHNPQQLKNILGSKLPHGLSDERWRYVQRALRDGVDNKGRSLEEICTIPEDELNPKRRYSPNLTTQSDTPKVFHRNLDYSAQYVDKTDSFPLEICLTTDDRDLLDRGTGNSRNSNGYKLAANLIATADRLRQLGYSFHGEPEDLFIKYCQCCSPGDGWDAREWEKIWESAKGDNPTPSLTDEAMENCISAWQWKQLPESERYKNKKRACQISQEEYEEKFEKPSFLEDVKRKFFGLGKKCKKGFGYLLKAEVKVPSRLHWKEGDPLPTPNDYKGKSIPKIILKRGQGRLALTTQLKALGWIDVIDSSWMGLGKSHDFGLLSPEESHTIFYIDRNHRNVSTETVRNNYTDLNPRHDGMYYDQVKDLQIARTPEEKLNADIEGNCSFADLFNLAKSKGHDIEGEQNPICASCSNLFRCHQEQGKGYGFKFQRQNTLAQSKIRCAVESLTPDIPQPGDIAIFEEVSTNLNPTKTLRGTWEDLLQIFDHYEAKHPDLYPQLIPIKNKLRPILTGQVEQTRYGLDHEALQAILGDAPENIKEIIESLEQAQMNVGELIEKPDSVTGCGGKWNSAGHTARNHFKQEAHEHTRTNFENLPNNLLIPMLKVWGELTPGRLRLNFNTLSIMTRNEYQLEIIKNFSFRIHLDATVDKDWLIQSLELNPDTTIEISEEMPDLSNLTVYNTHMEGLKTRDRSDTARERVTAYKKAWTDFDPNTKFIDYKGQDNIHGWWGHHNRGTNAFKGVTNLVSIATPYPNLGQLQDEYFTIMGTLEGFEEFYEAQVAAEIVQDLGRQRVHQFPDQQFTLDFVGTNQDLSFLAKRYGIRVINRHAFSVTPEAGTKGQYAKWAVTQAAYKIQQSGQKLTQAKVAEETGFSQKYISKLMKDFQGGWVEFKNLLLSLYDSLYRGSSKNPNDHLALSTYWNEWAKLDPLEVVEQCCQIIHNYGWDVFKNLLSEAFEPVQLQILGLLAPVFLPELMELDPGGG